MEKSDSNYQWKELTLFQQQYSKHFGLQNRSWKKVFSKLFLRALQLGLEKLFKHHKKVLEPYTE
jgi:hypothetical protein